MNIWLRVYPAIENLQGVNTETTTHNLSLGAVLCLSVYRTEGHAKEAAQKNGGLVLETNADLLKTDIFNKNIYISANDDDYIKGEPLLPTLIDATLVATSQKIVFDGRGDHAEYSEEDDKWIDALHEITNIHFNI